MPVVVLMNLFEVEPGEQVRGGRERKTLVILTVCDVNGYTYSNRVTYAHCQRPDTM